jgi:hypothetical protein
LWYLFYCFNSIDVKIYIDKNIGWCLTFVGVYSTKEESDDMIDKFNR